MPKGRPEETRRKKFPPHDDGLSADGELALIREFLDRPNDYYSVIEMNSGRFLHVSEKVLRATGYSRDEFARLRVADIDPSITEPWDPKKERRMRAKQDTFLREGLVARKDGSTFPVEIISLIVRFGRADYMIATFHDITPVKQAERELRLSEERFNQVAENSKEWLWEVDAKGMYTYSSPVVEKIIGYTPGELVGKKHFYDFFTPEARARLTRATFELFSRKQPFREHRAEYVHRNGSTIYLSSSGVPLLDKKGNLAGYRVSDVGITARDTAERESKRLMERLEASNRNLEQFAYIASHDLQSPLHTVMGYLQLIELDDHGEAAARIAKYVPRCMDGIARMQTLIKDLLAYSRVGSRKEDSAPVDCDHFVDTVLAGMNKVIKEKDAAITRDRLPRIKAARTHMIQLFQNLISNALEYRSKRPCRVHISARPEHGEWLFSVSDNGIGIPKEDSLRIFGLLERLHGAGEHPGTGIGLAICKRIVEFYGGRIWVESEMGKGSTFYFTMPAERPQNPLKSTPDAPRARGRAPRAMTAGRPRKAMTKSGKDHHEGHSDQSSPHRR